MPDPRHEATIAGIHHAYATGALTCVELTRFYLARIDAYDTSGPALRSLITVNPRALEQAAALDREYADRGGRVGPLHGIPTILKDNFDTADMPTTAGHVGMRDSQPAADAFTVRRMRAAGALILAKANMSEFALGGLSASSLGGQALNPYDLTRTPGGSSGGTAAAVAANFAILGTGSDTGQSIRSPASATNLVGVRPTRGLVSRAGIVPNSYTQDEIGPITRTVRDAALLLDAMAGYDPADPITAFGKPHVPATYTALLRDDALAGVRIGVMRTMFGNEARHRDVNAVMEDAIRRFESLGAVIVRFDLPEYDALSEQVRTVQFEARDALDRYFATLGPAAPVKNITQVAAARNSLVQPMLEAQIAIADGMNTVDYKTRMLNRDRLRLLVAATMADLDIEAILYPLQKILVVPVGSDDQFERNGTLSNGSGFPAITFPAGFSTPTASAPLGVPVGADLLGLDYTESKLLAYAYAFEQAARPRRTPHSTPWLPETA